MTETRRLLEIVMDGPARCLDGTCGRVAGLVFNPHTGVVTHIILHKEALLQQEFLAPLDLVIRSSDDTLHVNCRSWEVANLKPFHQTTFIPVDPVDYPHVPRAIEDATYEWPMSRTRDGYALALDREEVPEEEQALHRGTIVQARDGKIGYVREFILEPDNNRMLYLVLRRGRLWGRRDVVVPVSAVDHITDETVYLTLDKKAVGELPRIPAHRSAQ